MGRLGYERVKEADRIAFYREGQLLFWMKQKLTEDEKSVTVELGGDLVSETVFEIRDTLAEYASVGVSMTVNLKEVKYMAASYMNAFLELQVALDNQMSGAELIITDIPNQIRTEIEEAGIAELLMIE